MGRRLYLALLTSSAMALAIFSFPHSSKANGIKVIQISSEIMRVVRGFRDLPRLSDEALSTGRFVENFPKFRAEIDEIRWLARFGSQSHNGMPALEKLTPAALRLLELERTPEGHRATRELFRIFDDLWDRHLYSDDQIAQLSAHIEKLGQKLYGAALEQNRNVVLAEIRGHGIGNFRPGHRVGYEELTRMARERTPEPNELVQGKLFGSRLFNRQSTVEGRRTLEAGGCL